MTDCIILYSFRNIVNTGSAMTCLGKFSTRTESDYFPDDYGGEERREWEEIDYYDKDGKPFSADVIVWGHKEI